jgi:hypothetical protein
MQLCLDCTRINTAAIEGRRMSAPHHLHSDF